MKNNIKQHRLESNLSQSDLAKKIGVTRETISRVESGRCNPSLELAYKIAKCLNTTIEDIFQLEEKKILQ
ncbi:MAG: helix-turn-helix transcriptional regulator [Bacillota bacterium]|nr:helix-turn-helix transcriptional regulator [Bacillota bacterium]